MLRVLIDLESNASHDAQTRTAIESTPDREQGPRTAPGKELKTRPSVSDFGETPLSRALAQANKTTSPGLPAGIDFDLSAHPDAKMAADRTDDHFDQVGEENQDPKGTDEA